MQPLRQFRSATAIGTACLSFIVRLKNFFTDFALRAT
jgi:hypothetical protein